GAVRSIRRRARGNPYGSVGGGGGSGAGPKASGTAARSTVSSSSKSSGHIIDRSMTSVAGLRSWTIISLAVSGVDPVSRRTQRIAVNGISSGCGGGLSSLPAPSVVASPRTDGGNRRAAGVPRSCGGRIDCPTPRPRATAASRSIGAASRHPAVMNTPAIMSPLRTFSHPTGMNITPPVPIAPNSRTAQPITFHPAWYRYARSRVGSGSLDIPLPPAVGHQHTPQPAHRPQAAHRRGGLGQPQRFGHLLVGERLVVAHQDDVAVVVGELVDRGRQPSLEFVLDRFRGRRPLGVDQLRDERGTRLVGPRRAGDRLLAIDA